MAKSKKEMHGVAGEKIEVVNEPTDKSISLDDKSKAIEMPDGNIVRNHNKEKDETER